MVAYAPTSRPSSAWSFSRRPTSSSGSDRLDVPRRQIEILELKGKIQSEVKSEMDKTQREYILREQLKAIQRELGEDDPQMAEINELRDKSSRPACRKRSRPGAQGNRPHEPDPSASPSRRHSDLRRLARRPALEHLHDGQLDIRPRPSPDETLRLRRSRNASSIPGRSQPGRDSAKSPSSLSSDRPASARPPSASRSPAPWAASSCG